MVVKKKPIKNKDRGMGELLDVLKTHPHLVHALVFDHRKVKRLLKTKAARKMVPGVDATKTLLTRVTKAGQRGGRAAACLNSTAHLLDAPCAARTQPLNQMLHVIQCYGATKYL